MMTCPSCHQPFTLAAVRPVHSGPPYTFTGQQQPTASPTGPWQCPLHGRSKIVPAGVSKKSGKPYQSFAACDIADCTEKQPFGSVIAPPAYEAPLPAYQPNEVDELPF